VVLVNGRFAPDLSRCDVPGVSVRPLAEAARDLEARLGAVAVDAAHPFLALNTALFEDGVVLRVTAPVERPVHVIHLSTAPGAAGSSHPRVLVLGERASQATLVESYGSPSGEVYWTNAVTEIALEDGAVLDHVRLQRESLAAFHVATLAATLGRDARYTNTSITIGGSLSRVDIDVALDAAGAEATLNGLFVADGRQHLDTHTRIDHRRPHGTSREDYKGVLSGHSSGVFHGRILVRPGAQKTDAVQSNKNLLLSKNALVNSTPQLEILADDVKCKHGSTTGQLDEAALFYLRTRGISVEAARSLLTFAFCSDIASRIRVPQVRESLEAFLRDRLPEAPREAVA
jgi:Fe-S cluster assembly protein SufD